MNYPQVQEQAAAPLCFEQIMALLEDRQWQGSALMDMLPNLTQHLPQASCAIQLTWIEALRSHWQQLIHEARLNSEDIAFPLGVATGGILCWRLAIDCFSLSLDTHGRHPATLYNLAVAHRQLAEHALAQRYLQEAIAAAPEQQHYRRQLAWLQLWRQSCSIHLGDDSILVYRGQPSTIRATLLGLQHAEALLRQQSDPDVVHYARLPSLQSVAAARAWIRGQNETPGKLTLALMHPESGLVGVAAIAQHDDAATFYYWIGRAHQGLGYGRAALRVLKRVAFRRGIRYLFSSVFEDNARSIAVMQRAGYRQLYSAADTQETGLACYYQVLADAPRGNDGELRSRLQQLLDVVGGFPAAPDANEASLCM